MPRHSEEVMSGERLKEFIDSSIAAIRETVGSSSAIVGVSGGVDSTVAAVLVHKAIGRQAAPTMVDNGLLRKGKLNLWLLPSGTLG